MDTICVGGGIFQTRKPRTVVAKSWDCAGDGGFIKREGILPVQRRPPISLSGPDTDVSER